MSNRFANLALDNDVDSLGESLHLDVPSFADASSFHAGGSVGSLTVDKHSGAETIASDTGVAFSYGKSICMIRNVKHICGGGIGSGPTYSKFCALGSDVCDVVKHQKQKVALPEGYYIFDQAAISKRICYTEPNLPLESIDESMVKEMMDEHMTV